MRVYYVSVPALFFFEGLRSLRPLVSSRAHHVGLLIGCLLLIAAGFMANVAKLIRPSNWTMLLAVVGIIIFVVAIYTITKKKRPYFEGVSYPKQSLFARALVQQVFCRHF